jgi:hypothetical protein
MPFLGVLGLGRVLERLVVGIVIAMPVLHKVSHPYMRQEATKGTGQ